MYVSVCFRNVAAPNDAFINSVLLGSIIDALLARLSMVRAGSCYLTSHALLENPRTLPEDPYVVYLDANDSDRHSTVMITGLVLCPDRDTLLDVSARYLWVQWFSGSMVQWFR